jgi:flagellar biosynthesis chaperone FliJ
MPGQPDFERMRGMSPEEKTRYFQQLLEDQRKAAEEQEAIAMQQALGADERQWKTIEPKLRKVKSYREQAFIGTRPPFQSNFSSFSTGPGGGQSFGGSFGGGFQFQTGGSMQGPAVNNSVPWENVDRPLTDGERICEELQRLLQDPAAEPGEITRKLDALRDARERARKQWTRAQQELRKVLDLRQKATLVMMGLLN